MAPPSRRLPPPSPVRDAPLQLGRALLRARCRARPPGPRSCYARAAAARLACRGGPLVASVGARPARRARLRVRAPDALDDELRLAARAFLDAAVEVHRAGAALALPLSG